jgi:hypothetical protein
VLRVGQLSRFLTKIHKSDDGCWIWTAALFPTGYGAFRFDGKTGYAHRYSYEQFVAPIPEGLVVLRAVRGPDPGGSRGRPSVPQPRLRLP